MKNLLVMIEGVDYCDENPSNYECEVVSRTPCCVMPVHGLIHDDHLRACPCVLLGLMYGLRRLYVIKYLGFQFVGDGIKEPTLFSPFNFSRIPL
jgi:hypothetical protein